MGGKHDVDTINQVINEEVAQKEQIFDAAKVQKLLNIEENIPYVKCESFIGNPYSLLGRVIEVRKVDGKIPTSITAPNIEFSVFPIPGIEIEEDSKLKSPVLRQSIVINNQLATNIGLFNYLNAELDVESVFSINVIDQSAGLVDVRKDSWAKGVSSWKANNSDLLSDDDICYIYVIVGFIQKQIIRKKYKKFDAKAKGGAYGVNIEGTLHMSTEEYSMDIRYGLTPAILKRPKAPTFIKMRAEEGITQDEKKLFATSQSVIFSLK
ncbi:MAG: hypothetical protein ABFC21_02975 [Rectinema sp.]